MTRILRLTPMFVDAIPENLVDGDLYVSIKYGTVVHRCCCGCGSEVVTPLSPTDWKMIYDGETVSLEPSIGNWSFRCQSHYWLLRNEVHWARKWSRERIEAGRVNDRRAKAHYYSSRECAQFVSPQSEPTSPSWATRVWARIRGLLR